MFFSFKSNLNFEAILPTITLLVVGLIRFIPSIGAILVSLNQYKFHLVSLNNIHKIFLEVKYKNFEKKPDLKDNSFKVDSFKNIIEFKNINFSYQNSKEKNFEKYKF